MANLLSALNMTANTLSVNEKAISVVSHNVSNMNTDGYHKQRANLVTRNIAGAIGNNVNNQVNSNGGVKIANIMRYNDDYLNNYCRNQLSKQGLLEEQLGNLKDLAGIFDDLEGQGLDAALNDFYKALNNLNEYPASAAARTNFIEASKTLVSTFNSKSAQLDELTSNALGDGEDPEKLENSKIAIQYRELNSSLEELAAVNKALQLTQTGTLTANNLLDKRDLILNDIAKFVDISVDEKANGSVNVYTGDVALVKGATVTGSLKLQTAKEYCDTHDPRIQYPEAWNGEKAVISIMNEKNEVVVGNANGIITGGSLGGLIHSGMDYGDGVINPGVIQDSLNELANQIAIIFNNINTRDGAYCINPADTGSLMDSADDNYLFTCGTDADGNPITTGITAGNIQLNEKLFSKDGIWKIACAYFDPQEVLPEDVDLKAVGNAQNVGEMLETRSQKLPELTGMSVEDYYTSLLGKIASAGSNVQTLYDTQCDVVDSVLAQIDSAYGVDLNEELVDLVKYQTAYAAAAQVFNTCNSCLNVLMSLGG